LLTVTLWNAPDSIVEILLFCKYLQRKIN
jgi:hypothetical protein